MYCTFLCNFLLFFCGPQMNVDCRKKAVDDLDKRCTCELREPQLNFVFGISKLPLVVDTVGSIFLFFVLSFVLDLCFNLLLLSYTKRGAWSVIGFMTLHFQIFFFPCHGKFGPHLSFSSALHEV